MEHSTQQPSAHIRKPERITRNQAYSAYRRVRNEEFRADYKADGAGTYCGGAATSVDWDRRTAMAKKNADHVERECCPACVAEARKEAAK